MREGPGVIELPSTDRSQGGGEPAALDGGGAQRTTERGAGGESTGGHVAGGPVVSGSGVRDGAAYAAASRLRSDAHDATATYACASTCNGGVAAGALAAEPLAIAFAKLYRCENVVSPCVRELDARLGRPHEFVRVRDLTPRYGRRRPYAGERAFLVSQADTQLVPSREEAGGRTFTVAHKSSGQFRKPR